MGFSSFDAIINELTVNNKRWRNDHQKINSFTATAGRWYELLTAPGNPTNNILGNIVLNPGFNGGTAYWSGIGAGGWAWSLANNNITHTAGTAGNVTQTSAITILPSQTYTVVVTTSALSGTGGVQIAVGGAATTAITTATTTITTVTTSGSPTQLIEIIPASGQTVTIDDVLVFEGTSASPRFVPYVDSTREGGIYHGGNVSPNTKHVFNVGAMSPAAGIAPSTLMLVDILGVYPRLDANTAS